MIIISFIFVCNNWSTHNFPIRIDWNSSWKYAKQILQNRCVCMYLGTFGDISREKIVLYVAKFSIGCERRNSWIFPTHPLPSHAHAQYHVHFEIPDPLPLLPCTCTFHAHLWFPNKIPVIKRIFRGFCMYICTYF